MSDKSQFWKLRVSGGATMFLAYDEPMSLERAQKDYIEKLGAVFVESHTMQKARDNQPIWPIEEAFKTDPKLDPTAKAGNFFAINYLHKPPRPNNCYDFRADPQWNGEEVAWLDSIETDDDLRSYRKNGGWYVFPDGEKVRSMDKAWEHVNKLKGVEPAMEEV